MERKPVNKNTPPKTARIQAIVGWLAVLLLAIGGLYWIFKP